MLQGAKVENKYKMYVQRNLQSILVQTDGAESCPITKHKYLIQNTNVTGSDFSQGRGLVGWQSHSLLLLFKKGLEAQKS